MNLGFGMSAEVGMLFWRRTLAILALVMPLRCLFVAGCIVTVGSSAKDGFGRMRVSIEFVHEGPLVMSLRNVRESIQAIQ